MKHSRPRNECEDGQLKSLRTPNAAVAKQEVVNWAFFKNPIAYNGICNKTHAVHSDKVSGFRPQIIFFSQEA